MVPPERDQEYFRRRVRVCLQETHTYVYRVSRARSCLQYHPRHSCVLAKLHPIYFASVSCTHLCKFLLVFPCVPRFISIRCLVQVISALLILLRVARGQANSRDSSLAGRDCETSIWFPGSFQQEGSDAERVVEEEGKEQPATEVSTNPHQL